MKKQSKARSAFFIGMLLIILLACNSSINWVGYIFASTKKADQGRNATFSSATAIHSHHIHHRDHDAITYLNTTSYKSEISQHGAPITSATATDSLHNKISNTNASSSSKDMADNTPKRSENTSATAANTLTGRPNTTASSSLTYNNTTLPTATSGSKNTTYIQELPWPNISLPPISFGACCGIGHRLGNNLPTAVFAISRARPLHASWTGEHDVTWNVLFNDTRFIQQGPTAKEHYGNGIPANWSSSQLAWTEPIEQQPGSTAYHQYSKSYQMMFEMPLAQTIVKMLAENLSTLVLSYLQPMREQYSKSDLHLCVHVREGNNETGDWQDKTWRHIPLLEHTLNHTLQSMQNFTTSNSAANSSKVSLFVASDTPKALSWFEKNAPANWHIVKPKKEFPRPETGVWFGQHGSQTQKNLTQNQLNEAMSDTAADVFALGECSALFIPNYSMFSVVGIVLTRAERNTVFFYGEEWIEYPDTQQ